MTPTKINTDYEASVIALQERLTAFGNRLTNVDGRVEKLQENQVATDRTVAIMEVLFRKNLETLEKFANSVEDLQKTVVSVEAAMNSMRESIDASTEKSKTDIAEVSKHVSGLSSELKAMQETGNINWLSLVKGALMNILSLIVSIGVVLGILIAILDRLHLLDNIF